MGPLIDYMTSLKMKDVIPPEALHTFLVFSHADLLAAQKLLRDAELPGPTSGLVNCDPTEQLYPGLPAMEDQWRRALESLPPTVANYLIDQYEVKTFCPPRD